MTRDSENSGAPATLGCASCGAAVVSGASLCAGCGVALPPEVSGPAVPAAAAPVGSALPSLATSPCTSAGPTQRGLPSHEVPPVGSRSNVSVLTVGIRLQVAAVLAVFVSFFLDSYSVTRYYYLSGRQVTRYPLLVPGLFVGAIGLALAVVGTVLARRAKAERLAQFTSGRS